MNALLATRFQRNTKHVNDLLLFQSSIFRASAIQTRELGSSSTLNV